MAVHAPLTARTTTHRRSLTAPAHGCVRFIVVRDGSVILSGVFGWKPINVGDVLLISANTLCGMKPEGRVALTTVYLDPGYAVDQFYWQHAGLLLDRFEAHDIAAKVFAEAVQVLGLGELRLAELAPWLDALTELSGTGNPARSFARMQALS